MSDKEREPKVQELIADFHSRIEGLKRDGLPYEESTSGFVPWADAPEELKLEQIVGSAQSVETADGERMIVPGTVVLEVVERDVDYTKLPEMAEGFPTGVARECDSGRIPRLVHYEGVGAPCWKVVDSRRSSPRCRIRTDRARAGTSNPAISQETEKDHGTGNFERGIR